MLLYLVHPSSLASFKMQRESSFLLFKVKAVVLITLFLYSGGTDSLLIFCFSSINCPALIYLHCQTLPSLVDCGISLKLFSHHSFSRHLQIFSVCQVLCQTLHVWKGIRHSSCLQGILSLMRTEFLSVCRWNATIELLQDLWTLSSGAGNTSLQRKCFELSLKRQVLV